MPLAAVVAPEASFRVGDSLVWRTLTGDRFCEHVDEHVIRHGGCGGSAQRAWPTVRAQACRRLGVGLVDRGSRPNGVILEAAQRLTAVGAGTFDPVVHLVRLVHEGEV